MEKQSGQGREGENKSRQRNFVLPYFTALLP